MDLAPLLALFPADLDVPPSVAADVGSMADSLGEVSLAGGLLRWLPRVEQGSWTAEVAAAFPAQAGSAHVFAMDWLGRLFASPADPATVLLFEPGTGELLVIPCTLTEFHEIELPQEHEAVLATSFYGEWRSTSQDGRPLLANECVGYRTPLFLGGSDDVTNLERTDAEVYWGLTGQLIRSLLP